MNIFIYPTSFLFSNCCSYTYWAVTDLLQVTSPGISLSTWLRSSKQKTMFLKSSNGLWQGILSKLSQWVSVQGLLLALSEREPPFSLVSIHTRTIEQHMENLPEEKPTQRKEEKVEHETSSDLPAQISLKDTDTGFDSSLFSTWGHKLPFSCLFVWLFARLFKLLWLGFQMLITKSPIQHTPQPNL